jgi:hypothetical protein
MRVGIIGTQEAQEEAKVFPLLSQAMDIFGMKKYTVVTGEGKGIEELARYFAYTRGFDCVVLRPAFSMDKRIPFSERHRLLNMVQIVDNSDKLVIIETKTPSELIDGAVKAAKRTGVPVLHFAI